MRLRVLGCHGGESPAHRATCFLVDGCFLLDAGSLTRGLSVEEQLLVDHVFVSHAHLDHVRDLGLLADNIFGRRSRPIELYCSDSTAEGLRSNYFNDSLWPNFLSIPNPADSEKNGMLRLNPVTDGEAQQVGPYSLRTVKVDHSIDCHSAFVTDADGATMVYSGDTGPTEALWHAVNQVEDLRAFIFEVSFPNEMADLAKTSGHHTPETMYAELSKFEPQAPDVPILLYGMKPGYIDTLKSQIAALGDRRLTVLKPMDEFDL